MIIRIDSIKSPIKVFKYLFSDSPLTLKYYAIYFVVIVGTIYGLMMFNDSDFASNFEFGIENNLFVAAFWIFLFLFLFVLIALLVMIPLLVYKRLETLKLRWVWIFFFIGVMIDIIVREFSLNISDSISFLFFGIPALVGLMPDQLRQYLKKTD